jgi:hypothetical protein
MDKRSTETRRIGQVTASLWERIAIFVFGVTFVVALVVLAIVFPAPTSFQYTVFRTVLALAAGGVAACVPGFLELKYKSVIRAGGALAMSVIIYFFSPAALVADHPLGPGGAGGNAKVVGQRSGAEGGTGGKGGMGPGGKGGDAEVQGDNSFARGGDGGNAGTPDGRGGPRTLSPGERLNLPTQMWPYGYGGRGGNKPEYDRRLKILTQMREEYMSAFPDDVVFINAGIDQVPIRWVNKRLEEIGEDWRVQMPQECGYKLPPLASNQ